MKKKNAEKIVGKNPKVIKFEDSETEEKFLQLYIQMSENCVKIIEDMNKLLPNNQRVSIVIGITDKSL